MAAEAPTKEVNPKSERLDENQLGNFVRLPYFGIGRGPLRRQVIVDLQGESIPLDLFIETALESTVTAERVARVSRLVYAPYVPQERPKGSIRPGPWQDRLNKLAARQLAEGPGDRYPPEAGGRSAFLYAFGMACAESGLTEREIEKAVRVCDLIHTHKYEDRKDAPERYSDIARKAIQRETEVSQPW
jgi:hypothetical protein